MFDPQCCVRWLSLFVVLNVAGSCTAVNTDLAPIDGAPYVSIIDPVTGASDMAYAPIRDGLPYYLPRSLIDLAVSKDPTKGVTISANPNDVANLDQRYILYYKANPFSDDALCVGREKGLLSKIYFSGNDQTGEVLLNVIQLAGNIASPAPRPPLAAPIPA